MSISDLLISRMQEYLYRAVESGGTAVIDTSSTGVALEHQLCRIDVPMWMAGGWVVTIGPPPMAGNAPDQVAGLWPVDQLRNYALIRFGHGKATHVVEVDIARGLRICLYASSIDVRIVQPGLVLASAPHGMPYKQVGSIVRGELGDGNHCHRTIELGNVATDTDSDSIPIPAFARNVRIIAQWTSGDTTQVKFYNRAGLSLVSRALFNNTSQEYAFADPITIPGDATSIGIFNQEPQTLQAVRFIFELHL